MATPKDWHSIRNTRAKREKEQHRAREFRAMLISCALAFAMGAVMALGITP